MRTKRLMCMLMVCALALGGIIPPVLAIENPSEAVVDMEKLEWDWVDLSAMGHLEDFPMPFATANLNHSIPRYSIVHVTPSIELRANDLVTFDCSYSPPSASMDFGVITFTGRFYHINVKEGSINQAIRNNSSQTVRVVGFVNY